MGYISYWIYNGNNYVIYNYLKLEDIIQMNWASLLIWIPILYIIGYGIYVMYFIAYAYPKTLPNIPRQKIIGDYA